jgi:hypothetical protein
MGSTGLWTLQQWSPHWLAGVGAGITLLVQVDPRLNGGVRPLSAGLAAAKLVYRLPLTTREAFCQAPASDLPSHP